MEIEVNIEKKYAFAILGLTIVLLTLLSLTNLNAFGTSSPSTFGHSASEIANGTFSGTFTFNDNLDVKNGITLGGVKLTSWPTSNASSGQTCHWEESWLTYPNGGSVSEKTSCNVGQCKFKLNGQSCNPSTSTCSGSYNNQGCGTTSNNNDEWLYCCS